jgi:prepilin-type N-terminal cleavage/methylation domain-containing protein
MGRGSKDDISYWRLFATGGGIGRSRLGARRRRGFTLVEVIVVLVILAILAAIAIPALTGSIDKAKYSQLKADAREMTVALQTLISEAYADPNSHFPDDDSEGYLYIDGTLFASIAKAPSTENPTDQDIYAVYPNPDDEDPFTALENLTKIPYKTTKDGLWGDFKFPSRLYINRMGQIVAFAYPDISTYQYFMDGSEAMRMEGIFYMYNTDIKGADIYSYDPSVGYQLCKVSATNPSGGTATVEVTPL